MIIWKNFIDFIFNSILFYSFLIVNLLALFDPRFEGAVFGVGHGLDSTVRAIPCYHKRPFGLFLLQGVFLLKWLKTCPSWFRAAGDTAMESKAIEPFEAKAFLA